VVILPLAATEQHGPHLPPSTDLDIGMGLLDEAFRHLPDDADVWALAPVRVGASEEHARFPGTQSVTTKSSSARSSSRERRSRARGCGGSC
jgi:creatinine amidohydrolase